MSKIYKTARGKMVDIDKVKLANENAVAVGNMKVNARGDVLGANGQIVAGRNEVMDRIYAIDPPAHSPNDPSMQMEQQQTLQAIKARELHDLASNLVTPSNTAESVIPETTEAPARGSLASAVAKKAVVNQEPIPDPRKPKGPARI